MTIAYLKKVSKTPATGTDETRRVVTEMLSNIEQGGEAEALRYVAGNWTGMKERQLSGLTRSRPRRTR